MSIRIECPQCQASFHVEEGVRGKTVRCRDCGEPFQARPTPVADEAIQPKPTQTGSGRAKSAKRAASPEWAPPAPQSSSLLPVLLVVGGVGLVLFLGLAGVVLYVFMRSDSPKPAPPPVPAVLANHEAPPEAPKIAPPDAAKVPDAPPGDGREKFVDLPERGENLPGIAGLDPPRPEAPRPPPPQPGAPR